MNEKKQANGTDYIELDTTSETIATTHQESRVCFICWDSVPPPIQSGCACRGSSGLAHPSCLIQKATMPLANKGEDTDQSAWYACQTCHGHFTGKMRCALADAWCMHTKDLPDSSTIRLQALQHLSDCFCAEGKYPEAESLNRTVHDACRRTMGDNHPNTLLSAEHLAAKLAFLGKHQESEQLYREVHRTREEALGWNHADTLKSADHLGSLLATRHQYPEAEQYFRKAVEGRMQLFGSEHPLTLSCQQHLVKVLTLQNNLGEAQPLANTTYNIQKRVLGPDHPDTLVGASNIATILLYSNQYVAAEDALLDLCKRYESIFGPGHPRARHGVEALKLVRAIRSPTLFTDTAKELPTTAGCSPQRPSVPNIQANHDVGLTDLRSDMCPTRREQERLGRVMDVHDQLFEVAPTPYIHG